MRKRWPTTSRVEASSPEATSASSILTAARSTSSGAPASSSMTVTPSEAARMPGPVRLTEAVSSALSSSWPAVIVTVCGVSQADGVKLSVSGLSVTSGLSSEAKLTVRGLPGRSASWTVKVAVVPS